MKTSTRPEILSTQQWRALNKEGKVGALSRQASTIERAPDGAVSFIASTAAADRYGDTIDQKGWDTKAYEANPVLLWAHSYSTPPVGKVLKLGKGPDALRADAVEFTSKETHAFGAEVGAMVREGFLNTVSVGFLPRKWEERYGEGGEFKGYHFTEMELLEISVVPVPANPQALIDGRAFAKSLQGWAADAEKPEVAIAPVARSWGAELRSWFASLEERAVAVEEERDAGDFHAMLSLLERIAASSARAAEAQEQVLAMLRSGTGLVRAPVVTDAVPEMTLDVALQQLAGRK